MFLLLAYPTIFLLDYISIASTDSSKDILDEENKNATNGEKFIQEVINGKKPTVRPESLIFTAPFKLCKGECESNVNNFVMLFPIHVGLKRSQTVYKSIYPRDNEKRFSSEDNAPFRKSTTRHPYTLCPPYTTTSGEELRAPIVRPECSHRVSKVNFNKKIYTTKGDIFNISESNYFPKPEETLKRRFPPTSYRNSKKSFQTSWPFG
ncbi:uncharacterized protein LOC124543374 isoform X1 [Vanessa cardui]|uniref:uncharacterized protein LOC124543374 isoform X1 n=1 Tax=Vanessa cardui TaxID=171605 RepID=UPI001F1376FA|nr:uncharacterized protein LOC124543374 isoform X1 [Vanessa cardui]